MLFRQNKLKLKSLFIINAQIVYFNIYLLIGLIIETSIDRSIRVYKQN